MANSLVTLSSAAILAVYTAGLMKTRAAAELLEEASNERRPVMPAPATAGELTPPAPIEPPADIAKPTSSLSPAIPAAPAPEPVAPPPAPEETVKATRPAPVEAKAVTAAPVKTTPIPVAAIPAPAPATAPAPVVAGTTATEPATPPVATVTSPEATAATPAVTPATADDIPAPPLRPKEMYMDGTYLGWGSSRHGDIQASVKIEDGRIVSAAIARCLTRYSCSWVAHLPPQVVTRQSPDVDYVSGATQSANAFYWAVIDALNKAK